MIVGEDAHTLLDSSIFSSVSIIISYISTPSGKTHFPIYPFRLGLQLVADRSDESSQPGLRPALFISKLWRASCVFGHKGCLERAPPAHEGPCCIQNQSGAQVLLTPLKAETGTRGVGHKHKDLYTRSDGQYLNWMGTWVLGVEVVFMTISLNPVRHLQSDSLHGSTSMKYQRLIGLKTYTCMPCNVITTSFQQIPARLSSVNMKYVYAMSRSTYMW